MVENKKEQEIWQTTYYYPGYSFSNKGRIYSYKSNRVIKGTKNEDDYIQLDFKDENGNRKCPYVSRIIYFLFGDEPELLPHREVDHINFEDKSNNNINNLRLATDSQNQANQGKRQSYKGRIPTSSYIGVSYNKPTQKWQARIHVGKNHYLGLYQCEKNAGWVFNQVAKHFKDKDFWYNNLGEDFELPDETENRDQIITSKINRIQNYLDSL
jgi:hypothetical protein